MIDESIKEKETKKPFKNPPKLEELKQDLLEAKSYHDTQETKISVWLDNLYVRGSALPKKVDGRSSIQPKLIRKQAEWRYSSLSEPFLSTPDMFVVNPVTFEDKDGSIQNQLVLNYQFNTKLNKTKLIDDYVRAAVNEGTAIVRVGWTYEEKIVDVEVPDFQLVPNPDPNKMAEHQQIHQMMMQDPEAASQIPPEVMQEHELFMQYGVPVMQQQVGSHIEQQVKIIKNHPTVEVCDYRRVIADPTCDGDIDKASFVIYSFETSKAELKKDKKYKDIDKIDTEKVNPLSEPDHVTENTFRFKDEPRKKIVAYEYWGYWDIDGDGTSKPFVCTWVGDTIIRLEESPFPDGKLPFVFVSYLPVVRSLYGEPDGSLLDENQKIIGAVTRGMIDLLGRSANSQRGHAIGALDAPNRAKFKNGSDYEFNPGVDPRMAFFMHTYPEIPQSAGLMLEMQNNDAESLTGVKAFNNGISGRALGSNAEGIRSAMDATSKRELGILRRLADGMIQIGRKVIAMNALFLSDEEVVRVTNEEFIAINREALSGDFDLRLSISTAESDNEKAQELAFMLQTTGQTMGPQFSQLILADIARLRKMPDLAKKIESYQPEPDPMQQQMAQLQLALLEAQVQNEQAKAGENQVDIQLKQAKAQTEMAKARNVESKSDLQDLDFLEKESGVDVQKEIAKKGAGNEDKARSEAMKIQAGREKMNMDREKNYMGLQAQKEKIGLEREKHQMDLAKEQEKLGFEARKHQMDLSSKREENAMKLQADREKAIINSVAKSSNKK